MLVKGEDLREHDLETQIIMILCSSLAQVYFKFRYMCYLMLIAWPLSLSGGSLVI